MPDIPSQISFEHMLAHMFPGFFAALSLFMALEIFSPVHLSQYVALDITTLLSFYGILLLGGTIIGVIIDGIHHHVIEQKYFRFLEKKVGSGGIKSSEITDYYMKSHCCPKTPSAVCKTSQSASTSEVDICSICKFIQPQNNEIMKIYFFFDIENMDKCIALRDYLTKSVYHYSEFYANTFIALIPFSFIAPIYLVKELQIDYQIALVGGFMISILTLECLNLAWIAYMRWISALYFSFCRCSKAEPKIDPLYAWK